MKMVKSLLLGSAAGLVAVAGAQAADLPVKAKPVQYVKICSLYGAGYYYIPGTDTCIKIGGYVRAEWDVQAGGSFNPVRSYNFDDPSRDRYTERARAGLTADVRSQTEYGTLRGYLTIFPTATNDNTVGGGPYATPGVFAPAAFIQFAGFTWGKTASFFDFDLQPYSNQTNVWGSNQGGNGRQIFGYTAQFGNGFSASISGEDPTSRRTSVGGGYLVNGAQLQRLPRTAVVVGRMWSATCTSTRRGAAHRSWAPSTTSTPSASTAGTLLPVGVICYRLGCRRRREVPDADHRQERLLHRPGRLRRGCCELHRLQLRCRWHRLRNSCRAASRVITNTALGPVFDGVVAGAAGAGHGRRPDHGLERHRRLSSTGGCRPGRPRSTALTVS